MAGLFEALLWSQLPLQTKGEHKTLPQAAWRLDSEFVSEHRRGDQVLRKSFRSAWVALSVADAISNGSTSGSTTVLHFGDLISNGSVLRASLTVLLGDLISNEST